MKNLYPAVLRLATIATIFTAVCLSVPATLRAADYVVNDLTDTKPTGGGNGSTATLMGDLRFCVTQAGYAATGGVSTITFAKTGKITLAGHELPINDDLTITGPGSASLTIDAAKASRVFYVATGHMVNITGLTLTGGNGVGNDATNLDQGDSDGRGGALLNEGSVLTINACTITNNTANNNSHSFGGGICNFASAADATLMMDGCVITNNTVSNYPATGGGMANESTDATATLILSNTTISGNKSGGNGAGLSNEYGGGTAANVTINHCTISGNTAQGQGGGVCTAGGLYSSHLFDAFISIADSVISGNASHGGVNGVGGGGLLNTNGSSTLSLVNCLIEGNTSDGSGGGVSNALYAGDGDSNGPILTMGNCTVSANTAAAAGGGIYNDGEYAPAVASIANSTISGNTAGQTGGGISSHGNNFSGTNVTLTVNNTTLSSNTAQTRGGGVYNYSSSSTASVVLANCTVAGNAAVGGGGGIANDQLQSATTAAATVTLGNTLVALNATGANFAVAYGTDVSNGFNLCDDVTGAAFLTATGDLNSTSSGLQVNGSGAPLLQDNGVPPPLTQTVALLAGSAAIDTGMAADDPVTGSTTTTDQRGYLRPVGKASDIGAFEFGSKAPDAPVIDSANSAVGQSGAAFSFPITATNNPTSFTATGLPGGLVLNPVTGVISGTPVDVGTAAVTSTVNLTAANAGGTSVATLSLQIVPAGSTPFIIGATKASGQINVPFSFQITATHSPTSYTATGLPGGLTLDSKTGLITGTPRAPGFYPGITLSAANSSGTGPASAFSLTIESAAPVVTGGTGTAYVGAGYSYQIVATNTPTSYGAAGLPAGLSLNALTGLVTGIPTTLGTYPVALSATNNGGTGTATLSLTVGTLPAPVITSAATASGQVGVAFVYTITARNAPTSFAATGLPDGLSVDPATGIISGTPTTAGPFTVTLDAANATGTGTLTLTLTISPPAPVIIIDSARLDTMVGQPFSYQINASNSPTSYTISGGPAGLSVDVSTGLISGAPTAAGTFTLTLTATNAGGSGTATLTLTVVDIITPLVTISAVGDGVADAGGGKAKVLIKRTGDLSVALTVRYKVQGSAKAGVDFKPLPGTATIPAGADRVKIALKAIGNDAHDGTRVAKLKLLAAAGSGYTVNTASSVAKIKIIGNN